MTIYNIADVLNCIFGAIMMNILIDTFFKKRETLSLMTYRIGTVVLAVLMYLSNNLFIFGMLNAVFMTLAIFLFSLSYEGKISRKAIISVFGFLLMGIVEIITLFLITIILNITVAEALDNQTYRLLGIVISKMLTFMVLSILHLKLKEDKIQVDTSYWVFFVLIFINSIVTVFLIFKLSYDIKTTYMYNLSVLCSFGLLFSTFFSLYLYNSLAKQSKIIIRQQQFESQMKSQSKHFGEILVTQNQIKKFKHDINNHLIAISGYFKSGDCLGGINYIDSISNIVANSNETIETGNIALDTIINSKKALAENKNIRFTVNMQIPEQLSIDSTDVCVIFGNALDNAIEASEKCTLNNRWITLSIIYDRGSILCKIANAAPLKRNKMLKTTKSDKNSHGYGVENIKMVLAKYNSILKIRQTDTEFTLSFIIFVG